MSIIEDGKKLVNYMEQVIRAGANQVQDAETPQADAGIFRKGYPEWVADGETQKAGKMCQYNGVAYWCAVDTQRIEGYAPDVATNNYNPYPEPDADGVYPYIYGMGVKYGMLVKDQDILYKCILQTGENYYKLIYPPADIPALFERVEE